MTLIDIMNSTFSRATAHRMNTNTGGLLILRRIANGSRWINIIFSEGSMNMCTNSKKMRSISRVSA